MVLEVLAVIDDMIARWNRKDADAFAAMFVPDADFTDVLGQTAVGRPAITTQHQLPFTHTLREATLTADHVSARTLGADAVVARLHWSMTGARTPDDSPLPPLQGKMQVVLLRVEAQWQIAGLLNHMPTTVFGAPPEGAPPRA